MDPRTKNFEIFSEREMRNLHQIIVSKMKKFKKKSLNTEQQQIEKEKIKQIPQNEPITGKRRRGIEDLIKDCSSQKKQKISDIYDEEYQKFLNAEAVSVTCCPLDWWRRNEQFYPNLADVARCYLAIPASQAACERIFSTGEKIVTDERRRLDVEITSAQMCLHQNIKCITMINK